MKWRLNEPAVAIRLYACALIFLGTANLAMLVGPTVVIYLLLGGGDGLDLSRSWDAVEIYVQQVVELSSLRTGMVVYLLAVSFVVACAYIALGALIFLRREWVRKLLLCCLAVIILSFIVNHVIAAFLTGRYLPTLHSVVTYLAIPIAFLGRFTRADFRQLFLDRA